MADARSAPDTAPLDPALCDGPPSLDWPDGCLRRCQVDADCARGSSNVCHCDPLAYNKAYRTLVEALVRQCEQSPPPGGPGAPDCGEWRCPSKPVCASGSCVLQVYCAVSTDGGAR